jgi:hypothetical protein
LLKAPAGKNARRPSAANGRGRRPFCKYAFHYADGGSRGRGGR